MIIVAGIIAGLPRAIGNTLEMVRSGEMNPLIVLLILVVVILVTLFCVFVERAQRKIQVNYAKRQVGRRMMQGQSTHLPFKLNMAGCHPADFRVQPAGCSRPPSPSSSATARIRMPCKGPCKRSPPSSITDSRSMSAVRAADRRFRILLRGVGLRRPRYGRESQEGRRPSFRGSVRGSRRRLSGQGADAAHLVGRAVHHGPCACCPRSSAW